MAKFTDDVEDKTYTYTYDLSDRLTESYRSDNAYVRQSFNAQNLTSGVKFGFGGTSGTASYTYNAGLDNAPANATFSGAGKENFFYDALGRTTAAYVYNGSNANVMHTDYTYKDKDSVQTSGVVSRVRNVYNSTVFSDYTYTYDANGNITLILTGDGDRIQYTYDNLNRLTRCDDEVNEKTWTYTYDKKGNITGKKTYTCYAIGQVLDTPDATVNYTYGDSNWAYLFTSYNNLPIAYDAIGNMTSFYGRTLTWSGRRLATFSYNGTTASYTYNSDGIRTSKTVNGTKTEFFLNGTQISGNRRSIHI
ncbi:MAG: RHS repeat protein [Clostridia bacterium]|nr:RHS repeat protein [Clostridia bacterium]